MTTVGYIADVHVGNPKKWPGSTVAGVSERAQHVLNALERAVQLARASGCEALGVAGDLFDYASIEPQLVAEVQRIFADIPVFAIPGNHDMASMALGDHALAPLQDHVSIIETPNILHIGGIDVWCVPFEPGPPSEWLPLRLQQLEDSGQRRKAAGTHLMLHMGISDSATPYFLDQSTGHIKSSELRALMDQYSIDWTFSGDWHRHQVWQDASRGIVQIGCLAPNRFPPGEHEHGHIGAMVFAEDTDGIELVDVPGPRFAKLTFKGDSPAKYTLPLKGDPLYIKMVCKEPEEEAAKELLKEWEDNGTARATELSVDRAERRAAARTAAHEARKASSVDEAIRVYVNTMPLEDGVDRQEVLQLARRYL